MSEPDEDRYTQARERMVERQLAGRDIADPRVLEAMRSVPRHEFVPPKHRKYAYDDGPVRLDHGQTISQPYIVALMAMLMELTGSERVLEIGTGSGYQAAVLGSLAKEVYTVERIDDLAARAGQRLSELRFDNVHVSHSDGSLGLPEHAPYEGIVVSAAAPRAPEPLKSQLVIGGRLAVPVGGSGGQMLELWRRTSEDDFDHHRVAPVAFVPLVGELGWDEKRRPFWRR